MNNIRRAATIFLLTAVSVVSADDDGKPYRPEPTFLIKDADFRETLIYISGFTQGISLALDASSSLSKNTWTCIDPKMVEHKHIIDIANRKLSGEVTAERFSLEVIGGLIEESKICNLKDQPRSRGQTP